ncbi:hypothetical protein CI15_23210 [Paraburkholderia monticola]|uniref:Uncharacterized protein n=1 Tax=Paraburkholderia monticola TaxID=1399968 RepID=A0A149PH42_9BURK|nr:hypothetical protein CI15_23210 [Paraburkholderia monticola]
MRGLRFAVALNALLHLFVDLPQGHAAGAFQLVGRGIRIEIGFVCHGSRLLLMRQLDLATDARSQQA